MNLIWFLTVVTIFSIILGEFGQYPFGNISSSFSLTDIFLSITIGFFFIWKIGIKKEFSPPRAFYLLAAFWVVGFLSLLLSGNYSGGLYLLRFIFYSLSFLIGFEVFKFKGFFVFFKTIVTVIIFLIILGFIQILMFPDLSILTDFGYDPHKNRLVSTFLDPNLLGSVLNIGFILSLYCLIKNPSKVWIINSMIISLAIFLTFSRSAYLMMLIPVFIFGFFRLKKMLVAFLLLSLLLFIFIPHFNQRIIGAFQVDKTSSERIESWQKGLSIFYQNPILGVGFNNIRTAFENNNLFKVFTIDGGHSGAGIDSSLILILATTGAFGGVVYLSFWLVTLVKTIDKRRIDPELTLVISSLMFGLLINSQFVNSLFFPPVMLLMYLILGGFWGKITKQ